jgi:hypothetical protein
MKMSTAMLNAIGSALANTIGGSYVYAFITSDTRSLDDIKSAVGGAGVTPSAAGLTSLTGIKGTVLDYFNTNAVVVGSTTISVTYVLSSPMVASSAGTATYLVLCNSSNLTSGIVLAVLPIGTANAPIIMDNVNVVVGDKIKSPALTFSVPIPS